MTKHRNKLLQSLRGQWNLQSLYSKYKKKCFNHSKSKLISELEIESCIGVTKSDIDIYQTSNRADQIKYEIPISINQARKFNQDDRGNKPFIIPDLSYDKILGLI